MEVLVFKTNLTNTKKVFAVSLQLDVHPLIQQWNVDLQDRDKVLRIEATGMEGKEVEAIITAAGYRCQEFS